MIYYFISKCKINYDSSSHWRGPVSSFGKMVSRIASIIIWSLLSERLNLFRSEMTTHCAVLRVISWKSHTTSLFWKPLYICFSTSKNVRDRSINSSIFITRLGAKYLFSERFQNRTILNFSGFASIQSVEFRTDGISISRAIPFGLTIFTLVCEPQRGSISRFVPFSTRHHFTWVYHASRVRISCMNAARFFVSALIICLSNSFPDTGGCRLSKVSSIRLLYHTFFFLSFFLAFSRYSL